MINQTNIAPKRMKCVNCGADIIGWQDDSGMIRMTCHKCGTVTVSRPITRRHVQLAVYAPNKQQLL